mmetsp:Transcript_15242/g.32889  ORF Transcript_15242/g.32889 Transcript_15242/m.32889 type:complete len:241 (-) Transcript_15242:1272-1994(-)
MAPFLQEKQRDSSRSTRRKSEQSILEQRPVEIVVRALTPLHAASSHRVAQLCLESNPHSLARICDSLCRGTMIANEDHLIPVFLLCVRGQGCQTLGQDSGERNGTSRGCSVDHWTEAHQRGAYLHIQNSGGSCSRHSSMSSLGERRSQGAARTYQKRQNDDAAAASIQPAAPANQSSETIEAVAQKLSRLPLQLARRDAIREPCRHRPHSIRAESLAASFCFSSHVSCELGLKLPGQPSQ